MTIARPCPLRTAILARREELVLLTQELIRIPTLNPPGRDYRRICDFLAARLEAGGWDCTLIRATGSPGDCEAYPRWNLIARHKGGRAGDCVHFNSHHDVVEVGHGWTRDPFAGAVEGDKIYGRGACDMKGGLAASIIAAEAFVALYPDHAGTVEISATADEESGGYGGVAYLAEQGHFAHVDHVIIPEPLYKDSICLGHRGVWWAEIETQGRIAHGSMPFLGDCAVRHMGAVLDEMERSLWPLLAGKHTDMPVIPRARALRRSISTRSTAAHPNRPRGSPACPPLRPRPLPHHHRPPLSDRRGYRRGQSRNHRPARTRPRDAARIHLRDRDLFEVLPSMTARDAPVVRTTAQAIEAVLGQAPRYVVSPGTYDQKHIDRIGKLDNCIAYGPGELHLAHQPDEWIGITDMVDSAHVMALVLQELLA
ncbi:acetylornithine deacetylase/succinyl-diaminopimelate desuccinylase family protein [Paracoccus cavernae]|uniref:Acetylornithine deacetylase/succinyl-diaminopimelate desuccinylase family protein n=1 Tax=Paracoccus cavernae TaxID=1571207 RepID=A0ABT8D5H6_9RHOB|nr:acetylornithine deacetylase/succinyl-diaminopimelate desuccinylase family protein [Paracoccus cavernae]